jgi:hypothetical protein
MAWIMALLILIAIFALATFIVLALANKQKHTKAIAQRHNVSASKTEKIRPSSSKTNLSQGVDSLYHGSERDQSADIVESFPVLTQQHGELLAVQQVRHATSWEDEKDAWEESDLEYGQYGEYVVFERSGSGSAESNTILEIEYVDRNGVKSERRIRVRRVSFNTDISNAAIYAYCFVRQAGRTFIANRISRCVDVRTGEVIYNIPAFLMSEYENSKYGRIVALRASHADEIAALVYVSKIDGRSTKAEKEAIAIYLQNSFDCSGLSQADIIEDLRNETVLSRTQFQRCVGRLSRQANLNKDAFMGAVKSIIGSSKSPHPPSAVEVLVYIKKKLS